MPRSRGHILPMLGVIRSIQGDSVTGPLQRNIDPLSTSLQSLNKSVSSQWLYRRGYNKKVEGHRVQHEHYLYTTKGQALQHRTCVDTAIDAKKHT